MLPGVEHVRRRFYLGAISSDDSQNSWAARKPKRACNLPHYGPFSNRRAPSNQMTRPIILYQTDQNGNDKLEVVLEARERLEERLRASSTLNKRNSHIRLINNREQFSVGGLIAEARQPSELVREDVQPTSVAKSKTCFDFLKKEIYVPETKGGKSWLKLKSRTSEKEDCSVCLDCFKLNQVLIHLPCGHRFHSSCLIPWLDNSQHCPYCRAKVAP